MTEKERYNQLKKSFPGSIVLMKVGDFCETYGCDAQKCNELCGLTLTARNGGLLTGFPYHSLERLLPVLCVKGRVVILQDKERWVKFWRDGNDKLNSNEYINHPHLINNQKTTNIMNKKIFRTISAGVRYMFNKNMQSLVEVRPLREVFNLNNGKATQEWRVANTGEVMTTHYEPATEEVPEKFDGEIYHTFDDFEKGKKMIIDELFYQPSKEDHICCCLLKNGERHVNTDDKGAYCWTIEKGQAVKWYFREHIDTVTWEYNEHGQITVVSDYDGELPEAYRDSEDVYKYNDYRFVDADGHEEVREGVYSRLKLDDDQKLLANKLQQVLEECKDAGMKVYFSTTHYDLRAVNIRKVERIGYDPDEDEDTEQSYEFDDRRVSHVFSGVYDLNIEDTDMRFVIKKKQEA